MRVLLPLKKKLNELEQSAQQQYGNSNSNEFDYYWEGTEGFAVESADLAEEEFETAPSVAASAPSLEASAPDVSLDLLQARPGFVAGALFPVVENEKAEEASSSSTAASDNHNNTAATAASSKVTGTPPSLQQSPSLQQNQAATTSLASERCCEYKTTKSDDTQSFEFDDESAKLPAAASIPSASPEVTAPALPSTSNQAPPFASASFSPSAVSTNSRKRSFSPDSKPTSKRPASGKLPAKRRSLTSSSSNNNDSTMAGGGRQQRKLWSGNSPNYYVETTSAAREDVPGNNSEESAEVEVRYAYPQENDPASARGDRSTTTTTTTTSSSSSPSAARLPSYDSYTTDCGRDDEDVIRERPEADAEEDQFALVLKKQGLEIVEQEGDGNCLFRAISLQVYGDASMHGEVRHRCLDFMVSLKVYSLSSYRRTRAHSLPSLSLLL
jgi:hypothetical protein